MAAPQRWHQAVPARPASRPSRRKAPARLPGDATGREAAGRRRRFIVLVVVPVLLMLGSVYVHTVAAGLGERVAELEDRVARAEAEGEKLEVRVAELSRAGRIKALAREELHMREPSGADLKVYGRETGEDGVHDDREEKGEANR